jgi:hypothetical protein
VNAWTVGGAPRRNTPQRNIAKGPSRTQVSVELEDDGSVWFADEADVDLPAAQRRAFLSQNGDQIRAWLEEHCAKWNAGIERILGAHLEAPATILSFDQQPDAKKVLRVVRGA